MKTKPVKFTVFRDTNGTVYISDHEESTTFSEYQSCLSDKDIIDAIQNYLGENTKRKKTEVDWIPVTEKLPEPYRMVLCSQANGNVRTGQYFKLDNRFVFGNHGWKFMSDVVAWCELPEPYKRKDHE